MSRTLMLQDVSPGELPFEFLEETARLLLISSITTFKHTIKQSGD
jgi:hypothetical protein